MRNWNLKPGMPFPLYLGTDIRFSATDYCNDQIWELAIGSGEPPALSLNTTYGLRARVLRIFPRFVEGDSSFLDPSTFAKPVIIDHFFPNLISVTFSPVLGIDVEIEYWVPAPYVITTRTKIKNVGAKPRKLRLEWVASLTPLADGRRMTPTEIGLTHVLSGCTENIVPVLYMSGFAQPSSGPFTSLFVDLDISPKESSITTLALASLSDLSTSFELARQSTTHNWEAETARIVRINSNLIDIHTGDSSWDLAFTLSQHRALSLLFQATDKLHSPSYVSTRLPDTGFSTRGDGSDYSHLWNGQTPLETYYLISLLLPAYPDFAKGLLLNFLNTQTSTGFIDWKPGLAGQRSQILATPILVSLAWRIYQTTEDIQFLWQVYPKLLAFVQHWFDAEYDRDADGIPEWDHPMQTGIDEHPLFSSWHAWSPGIAITSVESPDLCSFLYQECTLLAKIANLVDRPDTTPALQAIADHMKAAVEASLDKHNGDYHYWDRESHQSLSHELLGTHRGSGEFNIHRKFEQPVRIQINIRGSDEATRPLHIFIHGSTPSGGHRVEKIVGEDVHWRLGNCKVTSERIYSALENIVFQGLVDSDQVIISTIGHINQDITNLMPLWVGIPDNEQAKSLIKKTILNPKTYWGNFGIRTCGEKHQKNSEADLYRKNVYLPYNLLIGEALVRYGQQAKAGLLVTRIMKAVTKSLQEEGVFRRAYDADTGQGSGERNTLCSLPPLGLFLEALGVHIINPHRVILSGSNPYPWPVTVKYQGLTVLRQKHKTMVIFPDGSNLTLKNGQTHIVGLE